MSTKKYFEKIDKYATMRAELKAEGVTFLHETFSQLPSDKTLSYKTLLGDGYWIVSLSQKGIAYESYAYDEECVGKLKKKNIMPLKEDDLEGYALFNQKEAFEVLSLEMILYLTDLVRKQLKL